MELTPTSPAMYDVDDRDLRKQVVDAARSWVGVRFYTHGRTRGGVDCVGLAKVVADAVGFAVDDRGLLSADTVDDAFLDAIRSRMAEIDPDDALPGDWFAMTFRRHTQHFAMLSERVTLIQASMINDAVTEHDFTEREQERVVAAFRYQELA